MESGVWKYFFEDLKKLILLLFSYLEKFYPHLILQNQYPRHILWSWPTKQETYLNLKFHFFYFNKFVKWHNFLWETESWVVSEFCTNRTHSIFINQYILLWALFKIFHHRSSIFRSFSFTPNSTHLRQLSPSNSITWVFPKHSFTKKSYINRKMDILK